MYIIPNEDYKRFFPSGLGGELDQMFDVLCQRALMIRSPVLPVLAHVKKMKEAAVSKKALSKQENKRGFVFSML